ncbi:hydroxylysine kinase-like isoform X1 [Lytechinus variegatus]|uniref:hydroxylysine kinase-like isoform X1 n=1 Tax=Lytechinus variegatus TaxID=7654 RepID=UPI001BB1E7DA|nr:hydroxylysine kinase-like isoform X1 [Lytechinus variegatus]XP_041465452.1 hydroxylysine kinase-like isoform X1 [Lytechinus variegatus]
MEGSELINRPFLDLHGADKLLTKLYNIQASKLEELKSFADQNFYIRLESPIDIGGSEDERCDQFILKLYNSKDSADGNRVELAVNTMAFLSNKEFCCPRPVRNIHGKLVHLEAISCNDGKGFVGKHGVYMVTLLSFLPGHPLGSLNTIPDEILVDIGKKLAHLHKILEASLDGFCNEDRNLQRLVKEFQDYNHKKPTTFCSGEWSLEKVSGQRHLLDLVDDTLLKDAITKTIDLYEEHVEPIRHLFKKGIIHGDFNDDNIIISKEPIPKQSSKKFIVSGIIDFGEVEYSCLIFDIAVALSELVVTHGMSAPRHFLEGYLSKKNIPITEKNLLYYLVLVRYAQRIMLSLEAKQRDPLNEYIMKDLETCAGLLRKLLHMEKNDVYTMWNI